MNKKQALILSILSLVIIVLSLAVSRRFWIRIDLSKKRAYTISSVSRNLHTEIPDQVRITYFCSDKLRAIYPMPGEIEDLLREYAAYSHGKIQVLVRDPVKAKIAGEVERLGIQPQQIETIEQDQAGLITVYSGIIIEYLDNIEVMPVVFSLTTLEYDLTSRIRALIRDRAREIGVIAGAYPRSWSELYGDLKEVLTYSGYRIQLIAPGMDIPDALPILVVLGGPESLDTTALYQIDRYIQTGGRVFFTVNGVVVDINNPDDEARVVYDKGLIAMIESYGIKILPQIAMDKSSLNMDYQVRQPNGTMQIKRDRYPMWIHVPPENGNPEHPVGAGLIGLDLYWASPLELKPPEMVEAMPIFTTTSDAWSMEDPFYTNTAISYYFEKDAGKTWGKKILGASLTGIFPSYFKDKPKPESDIPGVELRDLPDATSDARIIVVGETFFATSFNRYSASESNYNFFLQALDWLGNDPDIIKIRYRDSRVGRLDKILDIRNKIAAMNLVQVINIILMPLLVVVAAVIIAIRRRKKSLAYSEQNNEDKEKEDLNNV